MSAHVPPLLPASGEISLDIGTHIFVVKDSLSTAWCRIRVIVQDRELPQLLHCPKPIYVVAAKHNDRAAVTMPTPKISDNDPASLRASIVFDELSGGISQRGTPLQGPKHGASPSAVPTEPRRQIELHNFLKRDTRPADLISATFLIGTTQVLVTSADAAGNTVECRIQVTVEDKEPPVILCPDAVTLRAPVGHGTEIPMRVKRATACQSDPQAILAWGRKLLSWISPGYVGGWFN